MDPQEVLDFLYHQIFFIDHENYAMQILGYMDQLLREVPVYELQCNIDEDAVRCCFEGLTKRNYVEERKRTGGRNRVF